VVTKALPDSLGACPLSHWTSLGKKSYPREVENSGDDRARPDCRNGQDQIVKKGGYSTT
jgi:hypothetical protein